MICASNPAPHRTTLPFNTRSYHNVIGFIFSEDIDALTLGLPLNPHSATYDFLPSQKSEHTNNNFGETSVSSGNMLVNGLGALNNCDIKTIDGSNFIQLEKENELRIHLAGWYDAAEEKFPGHIISATQVPRGSGIFDTGIGMLNTNLKDMAGNSIQKKDQTNNRIDVEIRKEWDISPPVFRFIAPTANYAGDPESGGSNLASGVSGGNPVDCIEFVLNEAILDLPENTNLSSIFDLKFKSNDAATLTPPLFTTGITKLGKWVNDLNNQSDSDSNDQAFAINFTSNMPDFERIKWSFTETDSLCITDLRGNKLQTVHEEITLETVPPFILDTRAVVGSPKMYVKFNENITNAIEKP